MRKRTLVCTAGALILAYGCMMTHDIDTSRLELPALCEDDYIIEYMGYVSSYDMINKIPEWIAYELTADETNGPGEREGKFFRPDESVPLPQPEDRDYRGSGWTRGHLAPAADFRWDDDAMWETFLFTNCCPQDEDLNNGMWNTLEKKCRTWARKNGKVHIVTGPVIGNNTNGKIGKNRVTVPDAFFKAVLMEKEGRYHAIGFIMENKALNDNLQECAMSIDELEAATGLDLFASMEDSTEAEIEKRYSLKPWKL